MTPRPRAALDDVGRRIRHNILEIAESSGHGHIPTCFSVIECLRAIYAVMRHNPGDPKWAGRDLFILSKGHAALGYYGVLAELGYFDIEEVRRFGNYGCRFGCHADRTKVPGAEVSTGSLGHGIGVATGMALGAKIAGTDQRVFTLVGDGESNEGSVWEAIMVAVDHGLDNLTIVYDDNRSQGRCLAIPNPTERLRAFGCDVTTVPGHDLSALSRALERRPGKVNALVAETQKGYGCRTLVENMYEWHRKSPDAAQLAQLTEELNAWPL
jgi:transketolase